MLATSATLVIPTYNRANRLGALLECLTHQEGDALARVVVCDDGSSDSTPEVARSFQSRLPLVYAHQEDLGFRAGQARNLGIAQATGDVVVFVDDDVLVRPDFVEAHVRAHATGVAPRVVLGYRHRTASHDGDVPALEDILEAEREDRMLDLEGRPVSREPLPWLYVYSCNFSVRRGHPELWFDDRFSGWGLEDSELGYRLFHSGHEIVDEPSVRVLHIEDPAPRDPFRCETRQLPPTYDSYVRNAVYFMDKHGHDRELRAFVRQDLQWYVLDDRGHWVKNGFANDVEAVIARCREQIADRFLERPTAANLGDSDEATSRRAPRA